MRLVGTTCCAFKLFIYTTFVTDTYLKIYISDVVSTVRSGANMKFVSDCKAKVMTYLVKERKKKR